MLIPSIDLKGGRIVQLVQGEKLALESHDVDAWIARFRGFPAVQLIDLLVDRFDEQFHQLIAQASHNDLLSLFIGVLTSLLRDYMGKCVLIEGGIEDGITRHRQILDALKARYKQGARHAMAEHLRVSRLNVQLFDEMGTTSKKTQN